MPAPISEAMRKKYESVLQMAKEEIADIEAQIEEELARVKEKLAELQEAKKAAKQMYAAACLRLGIPNDLEEEEEEGEGEEEF